MPGRAGFSRAILITRPKTTGWTWRLRPRCACSILEREAVPTVVDAGGGSGVEVGMNHLEQQRDIRDELL